MRALAQNAPNGTVRLAKAPGGACVREHYKGRERCGGWAPIHSASPSGVMLSTIQFAGTSFPKTTSHYANIKRTNVVK